MFNNKQVKNRLKIYLSHSGLETYKNFVDRNENYENHNIQGDVPNSHGGISNIRPGKVVVKFPLHDNQLNSDEDEDEKENDINNSSKFLNSKKITDSLIHHLNYCLHNKVKF